MGITYIDVTTVPIDGKEHVSEITWVHENYTFLTAHHYFVDFPGAKSLERQITDVIGGTPLVRYSCRVVLQAFINDLPPTHQIAARTAEQKDLLKSLIVAADIPLPTIITFDDVLEIDGEIDRVKELIADVRADAPKRFGNAL